ncbi:MAG: hypothetical protein JWM10_3695 [Myxococcaceae bacterium]|nr:hypothetical protein [Myxococcaceae bacterium]
MATSCASPGVHAAPAVHPPTPARRGTVVAAALATPALECHGPEPCWSEWTLVNRGPTPVTPAARALGLPVWRGHLERLDDRGEWVPANVRGSGCVVRLLDTSVVEPGGSLAVGMWLDGNREPLLPGRHRFVLPYAEAGRPEALAATRAFEVEALPDHDAERILSALMVDRSPRCDDRINDAVLTIVRFAPPRFVPRLLDVPVEGVEARAAMLELIARGDDRSTVARALRRGDVALELAAAIHVARYLERFPEYSPRAWEVLSTHLRLGVEAGPSFLWAVSRFAESWDAATARTMIDRLDATTDPRAARAIAGGLKDRGAPGLGRDGGRAIAALRRAAARLPGAGTRQELRDAAGAIGRRRRRAFTLLSSEGDGASEPSSYMVGDAPECAELDRALEPVRGWWYRPNAERVRPTAGE